MSSDAEVMLQSLERRILAVEASLDQPASTSSETAIREYQLYVLGRLNQIHAAMLKEKSDGSCSADVAALKEERDAALAQVSALKAEMKKQEYRIQHLIRSLNEEEAKNQHH